MTKKELLEAIDKKMRELYPFTIDPFLQGVDYKIGKYDGLEFAKNLINEKDLLEAIEDMPSEKKNNFLTSSYPSGANAQQVYRSKYDESII